MADGIDEAREAFAQEIPQATKPRDQSGRFVQTAAKPEPIFQPRDFEGEANPEPGPDPRELDQERRAADGRGEDKSPKPRRPPNDNEEVDNDNADPERIGEGDDEPKPEGEEPEGDAVEDTSPRYKIQVDGEEKEVSLNEALRGYTREETFNHRMRQMVEVAKTIDQRGAEAHQTRDAYIQLCQRQEQEFQALIPQEPNWDALYKQVAAAEQRDRHPLEQHILADDGPLDLEEHRLQRMGVLAG